VIATTLENDSEVVTDESPFTTLLQNLLESRFRFAEMIFL
jgi:hypothetical protein